ncbi:Uncharacterised protein [Klebsiella pneumoniae]|nr:Uncharacterised protein [Klebsiella pneumoniae]
MIVEEFKSAISFGNSDLNIFTISENVVSFVSNSHKRKGALGSCLYKARPAVSAARLRRLRSPCGILSSVSQTIFICLIYIWI